MRWLSLLVATALAAAMHVTSAYGAQSTDQNMSVSERIAALAYAANHQLTIGQARWIGQAVVAAAHREGIDPWLLASVLYVESRFNHQSVSGAGAMGLGQLMPQTAAAAGVDPRDPWQNILGSAEVLRWNYLEFRSWPLALAAYNAGGDAVHRHGGIPPYAETQWYVRAVLRTYETVRPRRLKLDALRQNAIGGVFP
jgi:soluble lytic murein transglycosylase-like protein